MDKQNSTIKLRIEQIEELKTYGRMGDHWPDVIDNVLKLAKQVKGQTCATGQTDATNQTVPTKFKEATVDRFGKATISRTLKGRTIEYRVKE